MQRIYNLFERWQYELAIFAILFVRLFSFLITKLDDNLYLLPGYLIDYSVGFGGRKLIGSIFSVFFPDYLPMSTIIIIVYVICILLIAYMAYLLGAFIRRMKEYGNGCYIFGIFITATYLVSPFSVAFLFTPENFARFDTYLLLLSLLFIQLSVCRKHVFYFVALFFISLIGCLIHHAFISTYFILILALCLYDWYNTGNSKKRFIQYVVVAVLLIACMVSVLFFSSNNIPSDELYRILQARTDGVLNEPGIHIVYYAGLVANMKAFVIGNLPNMLLGLFLISVFLSPLYYMLYYIWRNAVRFKADRNYAIAVNLMNCCFLLLIPLCVVAIDYARWLAAGLFCQLALVAVLAYKGDAGVLHGIKGVVDYLKRNIFVSVAYVIFLGSLSYFGSMLFTPLFSNLMRILELYIEN